MPIGLCSYLSFMRKLVTHTHYITASVGSISDNTNACVYSRPIRKTRTYTSVNACLKVSGNG